MKNVAEIQAYVRYYFGFNVIKVVLCLYNQVLSILWVWRKAESKK